MSLWYNIYLKSQYHFRALNKNLLRIPMKILRHPRLIPLLVESLSDLLYKVGILGRPELERPPNLLGCDEICDGILTVSTHVVQLELHSRGWLYRRGFGPD